MFHTTHTRTRKHTILRFQSKSGFSYIVSGYNKYDLEVYIHTQDDGYAGRGYQVWTQQAKLVPSEVLYAPKGASRSDSSVVGDQFGYWMVSFNQTIIVSSPGNDHYPGMESAGAAYVFNGSLRFIA